MDRECRRVRRMLEGTEKHRLAQIRDTQQLIDHAETIEAEARTAVKMHRRSLKSGATGVSKEYHEAAYLGAIDDRAKAQRASACARETLKILQA